MLTYVLTLSLHDALPIWPVRHHGAFDDAGGQHRPAGLRPGLCGAVAAPPGLGADPGIPPEQRADFEREMRDGGVDWRMHLYGGVVHSFTNRNAARLGRPEVRSEEDTSELQSLMRSS